MYMYEMICSGVIGCLLTWQYRMFYFSNQVVVICLLFSVLLNMISGGSTLGQGTRALPPDSFVASDSKAS